VPTDTNPSVFNLSHDDTEVIRDRKRASQGRLTFDCMNAIVRGNRVWCKLGTHLSKGGSMALSWVLLGSTSDTCQECSSFLDGENVD